MKNGNKVAGFYRSMTSGAAFAPVGLVLALGMAPLAHAQGAAPVPRASTSSVTAGQGQSLDSIAAVVNGDVIMRSDLNARLQQVRQQLRENNVTPPSEDLLQRQVLDRLILEKIQLQMADRANVKVTDDQLNAAIQEVAQRNHLTQQQFVAALRKEGLSYDSVRDQIRREIILSQVQQGSVGSQVRVTDAEVNQFLENANAASGVQYHVAHILVPLPQNPTEEQVDAAQQSINKVRNDVLHGESFDTAAAGNSADENAFQGGDLGWRGQGELPSIFASVVPNMNVGEISEPVRSNSGFHLIKLIDRRGGNQQPSMVQQYKARHILIATNPIRNTQQAYQFAEQLRQKILGGEDFDKLARENSNDYGSALQGGELGWLSDGDTVPAFNKYLQTGPLQQVSQPIQTQFGWHLIEVEERRQKDVTVQKEREQARRMLFQRKAQDALDTWLQQIRSQAYVDNRLYPDDKGLVVQPSAPQGPQQQAPQQ